MESDDEFQLTSLPEAAVSLVVHERKLKRLKKAIRVSDDPGRIFDQNDGHPSVPEATSPKFEAHDLAEDSNGRELGESNEPWKSVSRSEGFDGEDGCLDGEVGGSRTKRALEFDSLTEKIYGEDENVGMDFDSMSRSGGFDGGSALGFGLSLDGEKDGLRTKRVLEFDSVTEDIVSKGEDQYARMEEESGDLTMKESDKKRHPTDVFEEGKESMKKKKRRVKSGGDEGNLNPTSEKMSTKERREQMRQLHAESQRLLRGTRDAAFKPIPLVQKPISSILEKIRQRKLELSMKSVIVDNNSVDDNDGFEREVVVERTSDCAGSEKVVKAKDEGAIQFPDIVEGQIDETHIGGSSGTNQSSCESILSEKAVNKESEQALRAPMDDTQLFSDTQTNEDDEIPDETPSSPLEEVLAPSILAMNLKLDSATHDDDSDEEDNDKENVDPHLHGLADLSLSPSCDPVKAFVDDEAEEEDDSDNDKRFQDNEDDEDTDAEELNDIIVTGYEEKDIDIERRNELHQKWLEQQDADGTEKFLQKLKCGPKLRESTLLGDEDDEEAEDDDDDNEFNYGAAEELLPSNVARMNVRKVKQMLPQMFSDKEDTYLSDDDETERKLVAQCLVGKAERNSTFLSPAEDESSRDVFGLIKKLNVVPVTKRKTTKIPSFWGMPLSGEIKNTSSKSSFLGRGSNHYVPSSQKHGSSILRSFIFGRDDSNSRSSTMIRDDSSSRSSITTITEEPTDMIHRENRPTKSASAKFSYSQGKSGTQNTGTVMKSDNSLFEILRHSSLQSKHCTGDSMSNTTESVFAAFKLEKRQIKKSIKMEGKA